VSSAASAATSTGSRRPELPAADASAGLTRVLSWTAAAGIGSAILIMIVASPAALTVAVAAMGAVVAVPYLSLGSPSLHAFITRGGKTSADNFYQLFSKSFQHALPLNVELVVVLAAAVLAAALLARLRRRGRPARHPACPRDRGRLAVPVVLPAALV